MNFVASPRQDAANYFERHDPPATSKCWTALCDTFRAIKCCTLFPSCARSVTTEFSPSQKPFSTSVQMRHTPCVSLLKVRLWSGWCFRRRLLVFSKEFGTPKLVSWTILLHSRVLERFLHWLRPNFIQIIWACARVLCVRFIFSRMVSASWSSRFSLVVSYACLVVQRLNY